MFRLALALLLASASAARAADAGYCVNVCGNACYNNPSPSCHFSCTNRCMSGGGGGPARPTQLWGAIAMGHPPDGSIGYATHYGSEAAARARAMAECRRIDTGKCDPGLSFPAPLCGAAATAMVGNDSLGTFVRSGRDRRTVEELAMTDCTSRIPNADCKLERAHCASD